MRIAYLLGSLNRGGLETLLLDIFQNAHRSNLDAIGIYRKSGVLEQDFIHSDLPVYYLPIKNSKVHYLFCLRRLLIKNSIKVVHAQQPLDAVLAMLSTIGTDIKVILTVHGYDLNQNIFGHLFLKLIIQSTYLNIFVSISQRDYYVKKYNLKLHNQKVVYNGISFNKLNFLDNLSFNTLYSKPLNQNSLRNELNSLPDTILIGSVGNFNGVRDQLTICRFLKKLHDANVNFSFVFVGIKVDSLPEVYDNCFNYCVQHGFIEKVFFLGYRSDVPTILSQLDAFIYATDYDTFGIAVIEAIAIGLPVFVNDLEVMLELTEYGKYATLYKTKNEFDLLSNFMNYLQNKSEFELKAKIDSEFIRAKYSIEIHINSLKVLYNDILLND